MKNLLANYSDMEALAKNVYVSQSVDAFMMDENQNRMSNYTVLAIKDDPSTGYYGVVVQNTTTHEVTLVSRGTDITDLNDLSSDLHMVLSKVPAQVGVASKFFDDFNLTHADSKITNLTGHSLGESDNKLLALLKHVDVIGFNGYGVKSILTELPNTINNLNSSINEQRNALQEIFPNTELNFALKQQLYDSLTNVQNPDDELEITRKITVIEKYLATEDSLKLAQDLSGAYADYLNDPTSYKMVNFNAVDDTLVSNNPFNKDGHIGSIIDVEHHDGLIIGIRICSVYFSLFG